MSSQPSSSKEVMSPYSQPPPQPQPPEKLERDLQGSKAIFFTLDTLFDRDFATERGLKRLTKVSPELGKISMDELKRAYHLGMAAAYLNHLCAQVPGLGPGRCTPRAPVDKVEMMFRELNLEPPSRSDQKLLGEEFTAAFNRNRYEVIGASHTLAQLQNLEYAIVVADDELEWDVVKDLNFWQYIDASIITRDLVRRKPDRSVFKNALDACGVSPKNSVVVGCSIEKDIVGILNAGAEPILYMPEYKSKAVDVGGKSVLVVHTMAELLSAIKHRPENNHLVSTPDRQLSPAPPPPSHPPMPHASQAQGYANDQNGGSSSQHHYQGLSQPQRPASDPKPIGDRRVSQSREKTSLAAILSQPGSENQTPRTQTLPDGGHPTKCYKRTAPPEPNSSDEPAKRPCYEPRSEYGYVPSSSYHDQGYPDHDPPRGHHNPAGRPNSGPSAQTSSPNTPQLAGQLMRPSGHGSGSFSTTISSALYTPRSPTPAKPLPRIRLYPPTGDYGFSRPTNVENRHRSRSPSDGYGHGASRNGYLTDRSYPPPPPPKSPYLPPIASRSNSGP